MANVLIADQSAAFRRAAQCLLESLGHAVVSAGNGSEVLELVQGMAPDLVIVDARLPGFEGTGLLAAIRSLPEGHQPCLFFVTENSSATQVRMALDAGADDYLIKPFDRELIAFKIVQARSTGRLVERPRAPKLVQDNSSSWRFRTFGKAG